MIKLKQAVIVEGKYDKIKLSSIIDATIIETGGFKVFSNNDTAALIKTLANTCGIVIMTDSDFAGFRIRNYIKNIAQDGKVYNAYLPEIIGKEKRKVKASKEGLLGVEGFSKEDILSSLEKAGVFDAEISAETADKIEKYDLYTLGLSGTANSRQRREIVLKKLNIPTHLSPTSLLCVLNTLISKQNFYTLVNETFHNEKELT